MLNESDRAEKVRHMARHLKEGSIAEHKNLKVVDRIRGMKPELDVLVLTEVSPDSVIELRGLLPEFWMATPKELDPHYNVVVAARKTVFFEPTVNTFHSRMIVCQLEGPLSAELWAVHLSGSGHDVHRAARMPLEGGR